MKTKIITPLCTPVLSCSLVFSLSITTVAPVLAQTAMDTTILVANDPNSRINLRSGPSIVSRSLG